MKPDPLDDLLRSYARQPQPSPSDRLPTDVWEAVRLRRSKPFWSRLLPLLDWRDVFAEPRLVASALALALAIGVLPAILAGKARNSRVVRESLHFEAFSVAAPEILGQWAATPAAHRLSSQQ